MALPATEAFTGTNGTSPPNANWTNQDNGIDIQTNAAAAHTNGSYCFAYWNADSFNNDQYSQAKYVDTTKNGGPCVRMSGTNNCYMFDCNDAGGFYLFKRVAGSYTNLQAFGALSPSNNDLLKIQAVGTTIKCFINGVQQGTDTTDSALASGSAGVMCLNNVPVLDDWEGGNVGAATAAGQADSFAMLGAM